MKGGLGAVVASLLLAACATNPGPPAFALVAPPAPAAAPGAVEVTAHPDPLALLDDADPVLAANKRLVFDMWRSVVNAGQVDLADTMLREDYIQHSPVLPTGRAAFKQVFSALERRAIPELVSPPLVTILAEGDLVVMALREELPQPGGEGRYTSTHFNLFRVEGGQLAEHWHSVEAAPGPSVLPPEQGGPQPVTGATGSDQLALLHSPDPVLAANKRLVFDAWRADSADAYLAPDFIDHDPTGSGGRAGFAFHAAADGPAAGVERTPVVAVVALGDVVVLVTGVEHPHPIRPGATYTTTRFDMFRIADGRLAEHWSGATKPGGGPGPYTN